MRVLHVIPSLLKGGAERLVIDICNALCDAGHEVLLARMREENEYSHLNFRFKSVIVKSRVLPSISGKSLSDTSAWDKLVEDFKPDVVHSHLFEAELLSRQNLLKGVRYFTHLHDNMPQFKKPGLRTFTQKKLFTSYYEKRLIEKKYRQCNNTFIAISRHTAAFFSANLDKNLSKKIVVIPNAIDLNRFSNQRIRQKHGHGPILVNVGSFVPKKNQQFLSEVLKSLKLKLPEAKLILLGDGALKESVREKFKKAGLENSVSFMGNVANVESYLWESDFYIHSASYEPFGLVIIEAMAAGLVPFTLDGGGNRDIIEHDKNGYIYNEADAGLFSDGIYNIWQNRKKWEEMQEQCRKTASIYGIEEYVKKLEELYLK